VINRSLDQAFEQYVFDRVDTILRRAGAADARYGQAVQQGAAVLAQLMAIADELEEQQPELLRLVLEFESATTLESGLAAEIAYREGLRDSYYMRRDFIRLMRRPN
jgi:hypothetical protein